MDLFAEIRSRRLLPTLIIYCGGGFGLLQVADLLINRFDLPAILFRIVFILLLCGIPGSLFIAWFHGREGTQRIQRVEYALHGGLLAVALALIWHAVAGGPAGIAAGDRSIAVLPFNNFSDNKEDDYFSDGMTEDILTKLSKIGDLRVVSRTSVMRYKHTEKSIREIAAELGVSAILEGSVRRSGNRLRIVGQLISTKNDEHLWAETYDREATDIFAIQTEVAEKIATALQAKLSSDERRSIAHRPTDNLEAYNLYLQGRFHWNRRTARSLERAIGCFQQAIALDSSFALAYAGLADSYLIQPQYAGTPSRIAHPAAQAAARHALALDSTLAETRTSLAFIAFNELRYDEAEQMFRSTIALNPRYPTAWHWYSIMLLRTGRTDEGATAIQRAYALDSGSAIITLNVAIVRMAQQRTDEAMTYYRKSIALDPSFANGYSWLGIAQLATGQPREAIANLQKGAELSGRSGECLSYLGYAYGRLGRRDEALALIRETERMYHRGAAEAYNLAVLYAGLRDADHAFRWLEQSYEDRGSFITTMATDRKLDELRTDPRFIALARKLRLTP